jgi:hypothetical protein
MYGSVPDTSWLPWIIGNAVAIVFAVSLIVSFRRGAHQPITRPEERQGEYTVWGEPRDITPG